ncbi:MAG: DUF1289 domain-containing protein [Enterobacterales bacterium]|nr:DUF1289 domain-containing protein [Enterobacterales bacterium]
MKYKNIETDAMIVQSPCVSNCCLDDDDICMGCFRHLDEITGWHSASQERRLEILKNCKKRMEG